MFRIEDLDTGLAQDLGKVSFARDQPAAYGARPRDEDASDVLLDRGFVAEEAIHQIEVPAARSAAIKPFGLREDEEDADAQRLAHEGQSSPVDAEGVDHLPEVGRRLEVFDRGEAEQQRQARMQRRRVDEAHTEAGDHMAVVKADHPAPRRRRDRLLAFHRLLGSRVDRNGKDAPAGAGSNATVETRPDRTAEIAAPWLLRYDDHIPKNLTLRDEARLERDTDGPDPIATTPPAGHGRTTMGKRLARLWQSAS